MLRRFALDGVGWSGIKVNKAALTFANFPRTVLLVYLSVVNMECMIFVNLTSMNFGLWVWQCDCLTK